MKAKSSPTDRRPAQSKHAHAAKRRTRRTWAPVFVETDELDAGFSKLMDRVARGELIRARPF